MSEEGHVFNIRIAKASKSVAVQFDELPDAVKLYIVEKGLSTLLNAATAKITEKVEPDEAARADQAWGEAMKKLDALRAGKIKTSGVKADGEISKAVMTEANRLALLVIKAKIKEEGKRYSDYATKALREAAGVYLKQNPALIETARANLDAEAKLAKVVESAIDVSALPIDVEKVEKRKAKAAETKAAKEKLKAGTADTKVASDRKLAAATALKAQAPTQHVNH